jgi:hypothetical protein
VKSLRKWEVLYRGEEGEAGTPLGSWVRFQAISDLLRCNRSETGSTQQREVNRGATSKENVSAPVYKADINGRGGPPR